MALTRNFKQTIVARIEREPAFAEAMLYEAATLLLNGKPDMARLVLRDLVNATVGFEKLALKISKPSKSLHRMLNKEGNPSMNNIATIFNVVRKSLGVKIHAQAEK